MDVSLPMAASTITGTAATAATGPPASASVTNRARPRLKSSGPTRTYQERSILISRCRRHQRSGGTCFQSTSAPPGRSGADGGPSVPARTPSETQPLRLAIAVAGEV